MTITHIQREPLPVRRACRATREHRSSVGLQIFILAAAAFVWLYGSPRLVTEVQAGGGGLGGGSGTTTTYVYNSASRLVYVIDSLGDVINYVYDADGNIKQVSTTHPSGVAIYELSPSAGSVGTSVTIYGIGFSSTAGSNSVSFNGTVATVASSTTTTIITTVPTNATTGTVSVTSPSGSANGPTYTVQ